MDAQQIKDWLSLQSNPDEGGYFATTYTSALTLDTNPPGFKPIKDKRALCSAIYYFLDPQGFSAMHRVTGDMLYHFYSGDPVQMLLLYPEDYPIRYEVCIFSNDLAAGGSPMKVIPGNTWLGSRLIPGGEYALMGVSMSPGFNPADYAIGKRKELIKQYPQQEALIKALTKG